MICYTGSAIVNIGSTAIWLFSLVIGIVASLKDNDTIGDNLMIAITNTILWVTVMLNVCYPCWPPFAFVLLVLTSTVELLYDLNALAG